MAFSPDYVRLVLAENFEDAKTLFLVPLMEIHGAHLVMLTEQGIVTPNDARAIRQALAAIDLDVVRATAYDGSCEDLFYLVQRMIAEGCGADRAGRLHTARSRNDIDMTMYRMRLRGLLLTLADHNVELRGALLDLAGRHRLDVFPAHTHTQPAQPTTIAHYLMAVVEQLERDAVRLGAAYRTTNRNPLGACAITGTGFPIDRERTSRLLGFERPTGNTYGSIATVDYLLESAGAAITLVAGIGRFVQDMLLWSTTEVGYLRLADGFVQASSIMPQKRNPVSLEHARALGSRALGELSAITLSVHNTPFGDIVDAEDDLQPLVSAAFRGAARATALVAVTMAGAEFDTDRMRRRAQESWVTVTELADTLVREEGLAFDRAHAIAGVLAKLPQDALTGGAPVHLRAVAAEAGVELTLSDFQILRALDPDNFIAVRRTFGGPAPETIADAIAESLARLGADERESEIRRKELADAATALTQALDEL